MKVRLISLTPTGYPNLALMKLSAYHKAHGDEVSLDEPEPDLVYVSSPFSQYKNACDYSKMFPDAKIEYGGYGFSDKKLPYNIEHCFDDKTEILTEVGWKSFKNLNYNDFICTLNPLNSNIEYQPPIKIISNRYSGKMILCESDYINFCVTPDHKLYINKKDGKGWETGFRLRRAEEVLGKTALEFKKDGVWKGKKTQYFTLPAVEHFRTGFRPYNNKGQPQKIVMEVWLEFLGYFLSEGHASYDKNSGAFRVTIAQTTTSKYYNNIKNCLDKLGLNYSYSPSQFSIKNKQLCSYLSTLGNTYTKHIPIEIKRLSSPQLRILLDAFGRGDGTFEANAWRFFSSSKQLIDDIQELLLKTRSCGDIRIHRLADANHVINYQIRAYNEYLTPVMLNHSNKRALKEIEYNGNIYCCEVPNHIIYVRRNGVTMWSGNSMPDYSIFNCDHSLGFTTRGCFRNCWFCIVTKMEGMIRKNSPIEEFHNPNHDTVELLDNNILYFEDWFMKNTNYLIKHDLKVIENGIDIRLVNKKNAERLHELNVKSDRLHF
ncbi:hypothetical protein KKH23_04610, partial [Patescibacteria group bacterium]|nr:hypothetical protein [Patescibacteria group bacterium]